jgi:hypothetical protein
MKTKWTAAALAALLAGPSLVLLDTGSPQALAQNAPTMSSTVPSGTRFLVRLEDDLSSKKHKVNRKFKVKTSEPLETASGLVLPPGAEIRGHLSRVEPASATGRARLWLTFDEIRTPGPQKWTPIVARVATVPGEYSVRAGESKEGEIEARTTRGRDELEAAAAGAAIGAVNGASRRGKSAAQGALLGAAQGFLIASGMGQELELKKGAKLELELDRPLYLAQK